MRWRVGTPNSNKPNGQLYIELLPLNRLYYVVWLKQLLTMSQRPGKGRTLEDLFRLYLQQEAEDESIFDLGFSTPGKPVKEALEEEVVPWADVKKLLAAAESAFRMKNQAREELAQKLQREKEEKTKVARQEASLQLDSNFLASEVQALMQEKRQLKDRVQQLERERSFLAEENALLRAAAEGSEEGGTAARLQEELRAEQQERLLLENEAMQLRARVVALERANQAQHAAMLSCIEESERVRLQSEAAAASSDCMRMQQLHISTSPVGHSDWLLQLNSDGTTTYTDEGDYPLDYLSHASCTTTPAGASRPQLSLRGERCFQRPEPPASPRVLKPPQQLQQAVGPAGAAAVAGGLICLDNV